MKTKTSDSRKRQQVETNVIDADPTFYVVGSSMNDDQADDENQENDREFGYPDFYEDTDNMNRYLW